jgi:hypothetical protein
MKRTLMWLPAIVVIAFLAACNSGSRSETVETTVQGETLGGVSFNIDLAHLAQSHPASAMAALSSSAAASTIITAVTVTFSRDGYSDIAQNLTVSNNVATGTVSGLAAGYWHITAAVFSGQTLIYTGAVDVNVIAGAQVAAVILFDPVSGPIDPGNNTGAVTVTVGLNKYPGYSKISQFVTTILQDAVLQKIYIFDSTTNILAVYNAATMVREQDITLQAAPQALAVEPAGGSLLLGYSTGKIYRLNIADQSMTLLADSLVSVTALVPVSSNYVLVASASNWGPSNTYKTINLQTGQVVSSNSYWYPLSNYTYNPAAGTVYALDNGLSPADMHRLVISAATGSIAGISDSRYHGDYSFGAPIRVMNNGTRLATGSGNMFVSSSSSADDITYAGNLGHPFVDLASDDTLGNLYMLNSNTINKLLVIDQSTLFTTLSIDIVATPKQIFNTPDNIILFVADTDYYVKVFSKTSLGLM